jgi:hypothetical protein
MRTSIYAPNAFRVHPVPCEAGGRLFDGLDFAYVRRAELHQVLHGRQRWAKVVGRLGRLDPRADILAARHESELLQFVQCRAHGVAAGLELLAQLHFGRQQCADGEASGSDALGQVAGDIGEMGLGLSGFHRRQ